MRLAFLAPLAVAAALSGCATLDGATSVSSTINPNYGAAAVSTFNAIETAADGYARLPACVTGGPVACRNAAAMAQIVPLVRSGRAARDAVRSALRAANGGPIPVSTYNSLNALVGILQSTLANYSIPIATAAK